MKRNTATYPARDVLWRDLAYFFHLQAEYDHLEEDIDWAMFVLPYWTYLDAHVSTHDCTTMQRGCLAIILAGAAAHAGNICAAFGTDLATCRASVGALRYDDPVTEHLRTTTAELLDVALQEDANRDFGALSKLDRKWLHDAVVTRYFAERSGKPAQP